MVNESQSVNSNSVNPAKNEPEIASGLLEGITGGLGEITEGTVNGIDNEFAELGLAPRHEPRIEFDDSPFAPILISKPKDLVPIIHTGPLLGGHPGPKKFPSIDPHGGAGVMITGSPVQIFDNKVPLPEAAQETNNKILENLPGKPPEIFDLKETISIIEMVTKQIENKKTKSKKPFFNDPKELLKKPGVPRKPSIPVHRPPPPPPSSEPIDFY